MDVGRYWTFGRNSTVCTQVTAVCIIPWTSETVFLGHVEAPITKLGDADLPNLATDLGWCIPWATPLKCRPMFNVRLNLKIWKQMPSIWVLTKWQMFPVQFSRPHQASDLFIEQTACIYIRLHHCRTKLVGESTVQFLDMEDSVC